MENAKILLVQLVSNGDCLFVTTLARQIKEVDYPGCHLTWMIGDRCAQVLVNNPHVDEVIQIPMHDDFADRRRIPEFIEKLNRKFDKIIVTENVGENIKYFYGSFRMGYFRAYGKEVTVPVDPVICLLPEEVSNVSLFAQKYKLNEDNCYPILFECSPLSQQSKINIDIALKISKAILAKHSNVKIILSCKDLQNRDLPENVIDGSVLSWRENAELTKYCKLLIGCSSGITWINTSTWAAKIPMLQAITESYGWSVTTASVEYDFMYWGLSTDELIELDDSDEFEIIDCANKIIGKSFEDAKKCYPGRKHLSREEINAYFAENATLNFFKYIHSCIRPDYQEQSPVYIRSTFYLLCYLLSRKIYFKLKINKMRERYYFFDKIVFKIKNKIGVGKDIKST